MIKRLYVKNYKSFFDASLELKPFTIFLGANSVGKSSIIQLLLMLKLTKESGLLNNSIFKLNDRVVGLGECINLIKGKDKNKTLEFGFDLSMSNFNQKMKFLIKNDILSYISAPIGIKIFNEFKELNSCDFFFNKIEFFKIFYSKYIGALKSSFPKKSFFKNRQFPFYSLFNLSEKDFLNITIGIQKILSLEDDLFTIKYSFKINQNGLFELENILISQNTFILVSLSIGSDIKLRSDIMEINEQEIDKLISTLNKETSLFGVFSNLRLKGLHDSTINSIPLFLINQILFLFQEYVGNEFTSSKIKYVSPIRAMPKRYYITDREITVSELFDGKSIAEVLKSQGGLIKNVNNWLKKFNLNVKIHEIKQLINQLIINQNNLDLDFSDVGFGISQVLPVIVQGFISPSNTTTIVEQPEVHLHPKMQSDLADLFIEILNIDNSKKFIIETHSEYFLRRLRRRIAEGIISADNVSICIFNPNKIEGGTHVEQLRIGERGDFLWPADFLSEEMFEDVLVFLKNQ